MSRLEVAQSLVVGDIDADINIMLSAFKRKALCIAVLLCPLFWLFFLGNEAANRLI